MTLSVSIEKTQDADTYLTKSNLDQHPFLVRIVNVAAGDVNNCNLSHLSYKIEGKGGTEWLKGQSKA